MKKHVRYPYDLFDIQVNTYATYHMQDVQVFYNQEDLWDPPYEMYGDNRQKMKPYYIIAKLPKEDKEEFLLMLPYTPSKKDNMIAWLAARSDLPHYGNLLVYKLSKDKLAYKLPPTKSRSLHRHERKTFLDRAQVIELLGLARKDQWDRCYLFILGLIHLGCRKNEWLSMEWQRIDLDQATATVPMTKNGEPLVMPLTPGIVTELRRIRAQKPAITGLIFSRADGTSKPYDHRRSWSRLKKSMNINQPLGHPDYFRLHDLRHSAASLLAADGATLAQIAEVLNHKSLQSTNRYKHLTVEGRRGIVNNTMEDLNG